MTQQVIRDRHTGPLTAYIDSLGLDEQTAAMAMAQAVEMVTDSPLGYYLDAALCPDCFTSDGIEICRRKFSDQVESAAVQIVERAVEEARDFNEEMLEEMGLDIDQLRSSGGFPN
jgi:hypothetical protein